MELPQNVPVQPGIYIFRDPQKKALYVGKANNLKARVQSYFHQQDLLGNKTQQMLSKAESLYFQVTESELEALLLEAELIKRLKPPYNIRWKDDKHFKYLKVDRLKPAKQNNQQRPTAERFPRVTSCRRKESDGASYYGPYPEGKIVNQVLRTIRKIFPYRDCSTTKFRKYRQLGRGCLYQDLNLCPAPCIGVISPEDYHQRIQEIKKYLRGDKKTLLKRFRNKMDEAAQEKDFETAAHYRDRINNLQYIAQQFSTPDDYLKSPQLIGDQQDQEVERLQEVFDLPQKSGDPFRLEAYDVSNLQGKQATASMVVLHNGRPDKSHYRRFRIRSPSEPDDVRMIKETLKRRLRRLARPEEEDDLSFRQQPDLILLDGGIAQLNAAAEIADKMELMIPVIALAKQEEAILQRQNDEIRKVNLNPHDPALQVLQRARDEAHRFALNYHRKLRRLQ